MHIGKVLWAVQQECWQYICRIFLRCSVGERVGTKASQYGAHLHYSCEAHRYNIDLIKSCV